jgi:hypothetical protein
VTVAGPASVSTTKRHADAVTLRATAGGIDLNGAVSAGTAR